MDLQWALYIAVAAGALFTVLSRDPRRQVLVFGLYGVLLSMLFIALHAPDVALSELAVGSVALPFVIVVTLMKTRGPQA